ncbi:MAG: DUF433 domain-containing protein [Phycisphaerales bacterium]|nr:DUF433 domain-containing protein [Phycisphaerales bacterium]
MSFARINFNPEMMGGKACIRGMRFPVATLVRLVASGMSVKEILEDYPNLEEGDIAEALEYTTGLRNTNLQT